MHLAKSLDSLEEAVEESRTFRDLGNQKFNDQCYFAALRNYERAISSLTEYLVPFLSEESANNPSSLLGQAKAIYVACSCNASIAAIKGNSYADAKGFANKVGLFIA